MAVKFKTKAWTQEEMARPHARSQLMDPESVFRKFLATLPDCGNEKLSKETMLCLGILWC